MKKKIILSITGLLLVLLTVKICRADNFNKAKMDNNINNLSIDYVPNKETAEKVAEAIWLPIYGEKVYGQKPYDVSLSNGVWIVKGTLPKGMRGGVAYIEINKKDCRVLKVIHGK